MLYHHIGFTQPQVLAGGVPCRIRYWVNPQDIAALLQPVILVFRVERKHCALHRLSVPVLFTYPCYACFFFILGLDFHQRLHFTQFRNINFIIFLIPGRG